MRHPTCLGLFCISVILLSANALAAERGSKAGDWEILFDGKSTDKWRAFKGDSFPDKGWKVENGALKTIPGGEVVDLITKEKYGNFEFELEWKISPGGNSGIIYLVSEDFPQTWNTGPEYQVLDDAKHADGKKPQTSAGAVYALIAPTNKTLMPVGEWNTARIVVKRKPVPVATDLPAVENTARVETGSHVEHWLNGKKVAEYDTDSPQFKELIAASKFKDKPRFAKETSGHIALQNHHDEVWYRNIRIRRL